MARWSLHGVVPTEEKVRWPPRPTFLDRAPKRQTTGKHRTRQIHLLSFFSVSESDLKKSNNDPPEPNNILPLTEKVPVTWHIQRVVHSAGTVVRSKLSRVREQGQVMALPCVCVGS